MGDSVSADDTEINDDSEEDEDRNDADESSEDDGATGQLDPDRKSS